MHHILLGLNPEYVGLAPFPPVIHHSLDIKARDLGININPSSYMFVLPNEAGFVGADNVGVLIAEEPYKHEENQLIIDIGTNGELVLGNRHKLISSSCATGPALEGAQLAFGMRAAPGAIERIKIDPETKEVDYKVIGRDAWRKFSEPKEMKAKGICGSGILDVLAELYTSGVITKSGVFNKKALKDSTAFRKNRGHQSAGVRPGLGRGVEHRQGHRHHPEGRPSDPAGQGRPVCRLQAHGQAHGPRKGGHGQDRRCLRHPCGPDQGPDHGAVPGLRDRKDQGVGNAAGDGCRAALLNVKKRVEANWCSRNVEYIELTVEANFQQEFMEAMQMPHMTDEFPHLRGIVPDEILDQ